LYFFKLIQNIVEKFSFLYIIRNKVRRFFLFTYILISAVYGFAQDSSILSEETETEMEFEVIFEEKVPRIEEFWAGINVGTVVYSASGYSYGGGLEIAYGRGVSLGLKLNYFADPVYFTDVLEICFLLRFYLFGNQANSGLFLQVNSGHAFFFRRESGPSIPAEWGMISAGLDAGWRFLLGRMFYLEPYVCVGYPYFTGGGLGFGFRF
jgi:hypothetical protein